MYGNIIVENNDLSIQFQSYIAESKLRFNINLYEWWKSRENKYAALAALVRQYFAISASPMSF